ncbi:nucleotide exchange factor GrpE [Anaerolineales bacterium HSG6]|nr:nucleotide exchange factor GrpE [Anaerolineales bacterium HSG6]
MSNNSFVHNITNFFNEPMPVLGKSDMEMLYNLDKKLDVLAQLLQTQGDTIQQLTPPEGSLDQVLVKTEEKSDDEEVKSSLDDLTTQVRKLAKTQFKANTLQESQQTQQQDTFKQLQDTISEREQQLMAQNEQLIVDARLELLKNLLPVMDSLDAAFDIGKRQVLNLPMTLKVKKPIIAWLDGVRLARIRLLDVLETNGITPIPTVGESFNPHQHIAVATDASGRKPDNVIVSEDRRGYATETKIIREAEVVVAKSIKN